VDTRTQVNPQTGDSGCGTVTFFGTSVNGRPAFEADWTGVGYFNLHSKATPDHAISAAAFTSRCCAGVMTA
jgi:hypothetical protein